MLLTESRPIHPEIMWVVICAIVFNLQRVLVN